jgi:hypothetical protein
MEIKPPLQGVSMQAFELSRLIQQRADSGKPYLEFLNVPDLSMGLYVLPTGGADPQSPHTEAEVYYVVSGRMTHLEPASQPSGAIRICSYFHANASHRHKNPSGCSTNTVYSSHKRYNKYPPQF